MRKHTQLNHSNSTAEGIRFCFTVDFEVMKHKSMEVKINENEKQKSLNYVPIEVIVVPTTRRLVHRPSKYRVMDRKL